MKKTSLLLGFIIALLSMSLPACKTKEGCDSSKYTARMDKKKQKRGKSNLFDKSMRKRM
ncbi:MAG: hypothetical protein U5L45_27020 [Saprospiraceae bacterium]|nr:hypothetical protein [Saprospiraceae bacterium]